MYIYKKFLLIVIIISTISLHCKCQVIDFPFRNETLQVQVRVNDLLKRLTVEEKISLLTETAPPIPRLGIEKYYHGNEALHGVVRPGRFTVFPQAIALASTWNPELIYKVATAISDEARGRWNELKQGKDQGNQYSDLLTFWSPTVNMARDPRWGRTPETYGEDPFLTSRIGVSFVRGLQGEDSRYLKVVSTPKHFAGNNEEHNRAECNALISEKDLREYYLPAFEACIKEGKAQSIMSAYNAINGVPCTANKKLLTDILRTEWGFNGYVVSDCSAPIQILTSHKYVRTPEEAAAVSIKAGLDLECGHNIFTKPLLNAFKQGLVSQVEIDSAASHVLRSRMLLGLFDDPEKNQYNHISPSVVGCEKHRLLALETARQSMVLLKNQNNFLPLDIKKIKSIAVVGMNAGICELGDYSGIPVNNPVSILDGIKQRVGDKIKIVYAPWVSSPDGYEFIGKAYWIKGLKAEYYSNKNLEGTPKVRIEEQINFEPEDQAPDPFLPKSPLSVRWSGELRSTISGTYNIGFSADDSFRLYIDDKLVINSMHNQSIHTDSINIYFKAGKSYKIVAEYFDNGGKTYAKLRWRVPENKYSRLNLYGEAGRAVKACDITVAVVGINKSIEREGLDRNNITLPADQEEFIREIYKINPKTVVILVAGSSLAINWIQQNIPAILNAWYPGEQGGNAVTEVLFGDYNPAGRLPLTYYNSLQELPPFDDYAIEKGRTYQYFTGKPLYAFGYGLSYTKFNYSGLNIEKLSDKIHINFQLKNSGNYDGDEVTQVYVKFPNIDVPMPITQLKGFKRIHMKRNEIQNVEIDLDANALRYFNEKLNRFVIPNGEYKLMVGSSSDDIRLSGSLILDK